MSDNRLWIWDRANGVAARIATFEGYKWVAEDIQPFLDKLFDLDEPSKELELIWEGDGKGWKYGEVDPELGLRWIIEAPENNEKRKMALSILAMLEDIDINGHACTCSGCESDEAKFKAVKEQLKKLTPLLS